MEHTYWLKQGTEPLFPDILWSRPESKSGAGKLCIIGGNSHGFGAPGIAYNSSMSAGVGSVSVLMPDAIKKIVKGLLPDAEFAPSTPSGSFSRQALDSLLSSSNWGDCTLLAGDVGRNSETAVLFEAFVKKYSGLLTITQDAVDFFKETPKDLSDRPDTLIVLSISQLQKLFMFTPTITPIILSMSVVQLAEALHEYTLEHCAVIVTKHNDLIFTASKGQVSTTKDTRKIWRVETAGRASVFWLQNLGHAFEAITSSIHAV
ncbi:hypothetical protein KBB49_00390 [Candidatus Saccharibacteria bacterium]|nr:hypothetical protein [Candidatus Saccharibacteria bacterium]